MSLLSSEFLTFLIFLVPPRLCVLKHVLGYPVWPYGKVLKELVHVAGVKRMGEESWGEKRIQGSFQNIRNSLLECLEIHVAWLEETEERKWTIIRRVTHNEDVL